MYCLKCGNKLEDSDKFCHKCGFPVDGTSDDIPEEAPKKSKRGLWIGIGCTLAVVIVAVVVIVVMTDKSPALILGGTVPDESGEKTTIAETAEPSETPAEEPSPEPTEVPTPEPTQAPTPAPTAVPTKPYKVGTLTVKIICNFSSDDGVWRGGWTSLHFAGEDQDPSLHDYDGGIGAVDIVSGQTKILTYDIIYNPKYNDIDRADYGIGWQPFDDGFETHNVIRNEKYSTYNGLRYLSELTITLNY